MANENQRKKMKERTLLPVIIIKGQNESGKSYISYFTVDCALASGYKFAACCAISSFLHEPFSIISQIIRRMLQMTMLESSIDRENLLMSHLPSSLYSDLFVLNHLFNCDFPVPDAVISDVKYINEKIIKLVKAVIHQFCGDKYTLICVDNADFIDDESWTVFLQLAEEEKVLIVFNLSVDFKEINKSSSTMLLKAYQNINTDISQDDIFAPLLCWYLRVTAVHTKLFIYLRGITNSKIPLLKEISLSAAIFRIIEIVPLHSIDEERLKREFFVDEFEVLKADTPMACDLKPGINLKKAAIPTNINDAVKESMNNLSIQDRLLLKRAAILGEDFDLHSLESISSGMRRSEVLLSATNLLKNCIFSSACALENRIEVVSTSLPTVSVDHLNICFCYNVYLKNKLKHLGAKNWPIGPYYRLKFRTYEFRSCMIGYMTKEQIYSMRMEAADNLESNAIECATCKNSRTEHIDASLVNKQARRYSMIFKDCVCLTERPRIYSEISYLYSSLGMIFLPIYFKRKAAQAANDLNFPIQTLCYIKTISEKLPQYWLMSDEDKFEEEAYFDPLILDVSLKKTMAEAVYLLGDAYNAASFAYQGIEMLGINYVCFHGAYNPSEFKHILSKFKLLHAECITKLLGVLVKAHLKARDYNTAHNLLKIEYLALQSYPIDFIQVLNHMSAMYWYKYLVNGKENLTQLENNIFRLCRERLRNFDQLMDLTEINAIGNAYALIVEANLVLTQFERSENTAKECGRILHLNNYKGSLPLIKIFLSHLYFHLGDYKSCSKIVFDLFKMPAATTSRKYHALSICCLSLFLTKSLIGVPKVEIDLTYAKCDTFATTWKNLSSRVLPKHIIFYISVVMSRWCLYSDKNTGWIGGKTVFIDCYELAKKYQNIVNRSKFCYWTISGLMLLLQMEIRLIKEIYDDIPVDKDVICKELNYLKEKLKSTPCIWKSIRNWLLKLE